MRAVRYDEFGGPVEVVDLEVPTPPAHGVLIRVAASGLCRSDWHGWQGHDPDITLPHVPGHELVGVIAVAGSDVSRWRPGERVTTPFACGCGTCDTCRRGDPQVCENQTQPGFSGDGSFAEFVSVDHADVNLVALPDEIDDTAGVSLGCRFATAYRAVTHHGAAAAGDWMAVHGCGGVGLSAVMIGASRGLRVIAVDPSPEARRLASSFGAEIVIDPTDVTTGDVETDAISVGAAVADATRGGAAVSLDALGSAVTSLASVRSLRRRGRHVQIGLLPTSADAPRYPMGDVIFYELTLLGSHGMAAHAYPELIADVVSGRLSPGRLVTRIIDLDQVPDALTTMVTAPVAGITVARVAR